MRTRLRPDCRPAPLPCLIIVITAAANDHDPYCTRGNVVTLATLHKASARSRPLQHRQNQSEIKALPVM